MPTGVLEPTYIAMLKVLSASLSGQVPPELSQTPGFRKLLLTLDEHSSKQLDRLHQSLSFNKDQMTQLKHQVAKEYRFFFNQDHTTKVKEALGAPAGRLYELAVFIFWVNTVALGTTFSDFLKKERAKACEVCYAYAKLGISADAFLRAYFSTDFKFPF